MCSLEASAKFRRPRRFGILSIVQRHYTQSSPPFFLSLSGITHSAAAVAAAVANGGGGMTGPGGAASSSSSAELVNLLSSAVAHGNSAGLHSFTEMVAGFVAGRGVRQAALSAATGSGVPTTRDTPSPVGSSPSPVLGIPGQLPQSSSFHVPPSG